MKGLIETIRNIWKIEELKSRILTTLALILIYRIGSFVILPGVNSDALAAGAASTGGGLTDLINIFAGGAFGRASVFALGIMPYISASIIMQLMGIAVPFIQKMQKEGESGRKKLNQWTRYLTIILCMFQGPGYLQTFVVSAGGIAGDAPGLTWWVSSTVILIAGTMFVMWLGEKITDKGLGNGISLIIMIGIIANLPMALVAEFASKVSGAGQLVIFIVEMAFLLGVVLVSILLVQGTRRIPIQRAKQIVTARGGRQMMAGGQRQYIPLKVNAAGVMPIIFAQAIMFAPALIPGLESTFSDIQGFWYNFIFAILIVVFTYFYTAIMVNPSQMADDLKRQGAFIPGVKPGRSTADFIDTILSRITLPGSVFLALVAILPAFAMNAGVNQAFAYFFGGTSLLIMVGVVLDTLQQIETHLLNRHYDGLMKNGRIKGRTSMNVPVSGMGQTI